MGFATGKTGNLTFTTPSLPMATVYKWSCKWSAAIFDTTVMSGSVIGHNRTSGLIDASGSVSIWLDETNNLSTIAPGTAITTITQTTDTGNTITVTGAIIESIDIDNEVTGRPGAVINWLLATTSVTPAPVVSAGA